MCLDLALGGEKLSIVCISDPAVAQGGPVLWLWLFCPVKTMGCLHSPPGCGLGCRYRSSADREAEGRAGDPQEKGERAVGSRPAPLAVCGQERVSVAGPGDRNAL